MGRKGERAVKNILLIGDSIRMGYDKYVAMALEGQAQVYFPKENCRFTQYVLRHLQDWLKDSGFGPNTDLVHWNVGLWDVLELSDDGPITPVEWYEQYIHRICRRIRKLCPKAKVVFATSTPIHTLWYEEKRNVFFRSNDNIRLFNEAAIRAVKEHGFGVNDLYSLLENVPENYFSDRTHYYTEPATKCITNRVLDVIEDQLGIRGKALDFAGLFGASNSDVGF